MRSPPPRAFSRRDASGLLLGALGLAAIPAKLMAASERFGPAKAFSWDKLVEQARKLAASEYRDRPASANAAPDFDAFGKLTYGAAEALFGTVRLFPTGKGVADRPVAIHFLEKGKARELVDTSGLYVGGARADAAGFRILDTGGQTDWMAFLGASYFRSSGSRNQYGLSARGIAVDTGTGRAEEFPAFTAFWLEPAANGRLKIYALLDGPSLSGAFAFDCAKTAEGVVQDVRASLFFRRDIKRLGIAPASSMYWYDQHDQRADWRPEIHDSDGMAIWSGTGERVWRPLENPKDARVTVLRASSPKGFGLMQRDQMFDHYQDDGAFYDRRPSLWVEPRGDWGEGSVMLYEMPTDGETQDNVAAFWTPDAPARAGGQRELAYRLTWTSREPSIAGEDIARCIDMFEGPAGKPGFAALRDARKFVFDFSGAVLDGLTRADGVEAATDLPADALIAAAAYPVEGSPGRWRVMLDVRHDAAPRPEFRVYLKRGSAALSETVIKMLTA